MPTQPHAWRHTELGFRGGLVRARKGRDLDFRGDSSDGVRTSTGRGWEPGSPGSWPGPGRARSPSRAGPPPR
eukprot:1874158-Rhodomonas_salina.2